MLVSASRTNAHLDNTTEKSMSSISTRSQTHTFLARIRSALRGVLRDRRGASTVEYLVLVAFIALGGIAAMEALRDHIKTGADSVGVKVDKLEAYR